MPRSSAATLPTPGSICGRCSGVRTGTGDFVRSIAAVGREQQVFLALTQQLGSSFDLVKILECVESGLRSLIPHEAMAIFILQGDTLVMRHSAGECKEMLSSEVRSGERAWLDGSRKTSNPSSTVIPRWNADIKAARRTA